MKPDIDVVIPQFNNADKTVRLLGSINAHYKDHHTLKVRVILVDNGSAPSEFEKANDAIVAMEMPSVVIRVGENLGFVRGTNVGLGASEAGLLVLQNNDTEVFFGAYDIMAHQLKLRPSVGAVGPVSSETEHSWQSWDRLLERKIINVSQGRFQAMPGYDRALHLRDVHQTELFKVDLMLSFFCVMVRRDVFDRIGLLSNDFGVGLGDDDDFCARMRQAGYELGLSLGTYVHHDGRSTFKAVYTPEELKGMSAKAKETLKEKYPSDYNFLM